MREPSRYEQEVIAEMTDQQRSALKAWDAEISRSADAACAAVGNDLTLSAAIYGYLGVYCGPFGNKASNEDALLGLIGGVYSDFPKGAEGIAALRASEGLSALSEWMWEELECAGAEADEVVKAVLPRLRAILGGQEGDA